MAQIIILGLMTLVVVGMAAVLFYMAFKAHCAALKLVETRIASALQQMASESAAIKEAVVTIAVSKRISEILEVKGKDMNIKPEEFEAKREEIRAKMMAALDERVATRKKNPNFAPSTVAYCVLKDSGFEEFAADGVHLKAQNALARLVANDNIPGARRLITLFANSL